MSVSAKLELQNGTPFPVTWVHLEREGEPPGPDVANALKETLAPHRAVVMENIAPGSVRVACAFHTRQAEDHVRGPYVELKEDDAISVRIDFDSSRGYRVQHRDAKVYETSHGGSRRHTGRYTWTGTPGQRSHKK